MTRRARNRGRRKGTGAGKLTHWGRQGGIQSSEHRRQVEPYRRTRKQPHARQRRGDAARRAAAARRAGKGRVSDKGSDSAAQREQRDRPWRIGAASMPSAGSTEQGGRSWGPGPAARPPRWRPAAGDEPRRAEARRRRRKTYTLVDVPLGLFQKAVPSGRSDGTPCAQRQMRFRLRSHRSTTFFARQAAAHFLLTFLPPPSWVLDARADGTVSAVQTAGSDARPASGPPLLEPSVGRPKGVLRDDGRRAGGSRRLRRHLRPAPRALECAQATHSGPGKAASTDRCRLPIGLPSCRLGFPTARRSLATSGTIPFRPRRSRWLVHEHS